MSGGVAAPEVRGRYFFVKRPRIRIAGTILSIVVFALIARSISAALATPASDTLSRLKVSTAANHELLFKTPSGIDASSDTIVLTFSGFDLSTLTSSDVSLLWGVTGNEHTTSVAAVPAAGTWGVGISGTTVTLTAPTDSAPGSIPSNDRITVRIGLNAGGSHQMVNPGTAGPAYETIGGTFGDTSTIGIAIIDNDSVTVSAVVPSATTTPPCTTCGGSTGGGTGGSSPPVISNIQVTNITSNSAHITWVTDKPANSSVSYGQTTSYASGTVSDGTLVVNHALDLTGLTPSMVYHFYVQSTDSTSLTAVSSDQTFTTLGDTTPPVISNIQVTNITETSALVTWSTNEPSTSDVFYGTTVSYGFTANTTGYVTTHAVQLNGLSPLTGYHFFVRSSDVAGNTTNSSDGTFTTSGDVTPPANVSNLTAVPGDTTVSLSWSLPPDADFAGTKILRKTGSYPTGPFDGILVYDGTGASTVDTGLTNGVTYLYGAYAYDTNSNFASGALAQATPNGVSPVVTPTSTPPAPPSPATQPPTPPSVPPVGPTPTPAGSTVTVDVAVYYYGNNGSIQLVPDVNGNISALSGSEIQVIVPLAGIGQTPTSMTLNVGGSLYALQPGPNGTDYRGIFVVPSAGVYPSNVTVQFSGGGQAIVSNTLVAKSAGTVVEEGLTGPTGTTVPGAQIQLYRDVNGVWTPYGSATADANGAYGFTVPNGRYYIEVQHDGYRTAVTVPTQIGDNVFNQQVSLIKIPVVPVLTATSTLAERVAAAVTNLASQTSYGVQLIRQTLQSPAVQAANAIAAPLIMIAVLANAAASLSLFNLLAYLQYLFTQPLLLFERRRKRKWGTIYNSLTKEPVKLAIVRLLDAQTRIVLQTRVTDKFGRYWFVVHAGRYLLEVVKPGFVFPTSYLTGHKEDVDYTDLYHGAPMERTEGEVIAMNIPLDPVTAEETPRKILWQKFARRLRHGVAFSGVLLGMVVLVISPSLLNALLVMAQVGIYLLFRRLALPAKAKSWGVTFDAKTRKPLDRVIVRIFDKKFNKLLETQVTDANGKYGFFVRRNVYYLTAQKAQYKPYRSPDIDLSNKDEGLVDQNISLTPL